MVVKEKKEIATTTSTIKRTTTTTRTLTCLKKTLSFQYASQKLSQMFVKPINNT